MKGEGISEDKISTCVQGLIIPLKFLKNIALQLYVDATWNFQ